ncbi:MAG: D-alanyl-D-alanine carboxypeptidase [Proteobacteria bacterium]|nr:MAG: D-alanyl-D-alanine carboxypeptidase [Pseudomonadota bacterium]
MSSSFEKRFLEKMGETWEDGTQGLCVQAYSKGRKIVDLEVGKTYPYYDLASLTKILFTTPALMMLKDEKRFRVTDPVSRWVPWFPEDHPARIKDLLTHSAGMTWWYPFYQKLAPKTAKVKTPEEAWDIFQVVLKKRILADLEKNPVSFPVEKSVYSDLDYFLLGIALESITGTTLYTAWANLRDRLDLRETDFHRGNKPKHSRSDYAPTEKDAWRGKTLQGEVHDENTWALKGVAPHAGLFGPIHDVTGFGLLLRGAMRGKGANNFPSHETVKLFTKRSIPRSRGDWGLGFVMPSKAGSTAGPLFDLKSVGHTGFTGTSLWYDPVKDLLITILSNRVYPTRENTAFQKLRPQIHTWISEAL